jgi:hypothetical protein
LVISKLLWPAVEPDTFWFDTYVKPVSMRPYNVTLL